jgi:hypothetical protein
VLSLLIHSLAGADQMCGPLISEVRAVHLRLSDLGSQIIGRPIRRIGFS